MITCLFSCVECGLTDQEVSVPSRESPNLNVVKYVEEFVVPVIAKKHRELRPKCQATKITNLKMPLPSINEDPDAWVGKQTDHVPPKEEKY